VTATDGSTPPVTGTGKTTVVAAAVIAKLQLLVPPSVKVGVAVQVTVIPEDAQGNPVQNYSGTVTLSSSDGSATFSSTTITFKNGTPTTPPVTVSFATAGSQTVTATDDSTPPVTVTVKTTVG
jgi:hypothetical protein